MPLFQLQDLEGLIFEPVYQRLNEDLGGGIRYDLFSESADSMVNKLTGYSNDDLTELPDLLAQIKVPYAWIIEKLSQRLVTLDSDQYAISVSQNFKAAQDMLSKITKLESSSSDETIGSHEIKNLWARY